MGATTAVALKWAAHGSLHGHCLRLQMCTTRVGACSSRATATGLTRPASTSPVAVLTFLARYAFRTASLRGDFRRVYLAHERERRTVSRRLRKQPLSDGRFDGRTESPQTSPRGVLPARGALASPRRGSASPLATPRRGSAKQTNKNE